jgi:hypothetical protein
MTRDMILSMLRHTNVGSCLLGFENVLYPIHRLEGEVSRFINFLIVCHLLSGKSYEDILSTDELCSILLRCIQPNYFHFSIHSRVINEWMNFNPNKTRFEAITKLLEDNMKFIRRSIGIIGLIPLNTIFIRSRQLSDELYKSTLRGSLNWIPHSHEDHFAYNWWFLTIDNKFNNTRLILMENIEVFAKHLQWVKGIVAFKCHQRINHVHALIWMIIPVTGMFMQTKFSLEDQIVIEPVRQSPIACMIYMESQANDLPIFWPNPEIAVKMKNCSWIMPPKNEKNHDWKKIIENGINWGSPWYSLRPRVPIIPHNQRLKFKKLSRIKAMKTLTNWKISVTRIYQENMLDILIGWLEIFGPGCIWWSNNELTSWDGEPIMYCLSDEEFVKAYEFINQKHFPIVALIGIKS